MTDFIINPGVNPSGIDQTNIATGFNPWKWIAEYLAEWL
jgi:hypothetical protein